MKPFIIPFFLPHQGCPHTCIYCNQHASGGRRPEPVTPESVRRGLEAGLGSTRLKASSRVEAAFFGGTFTALARSRQQDLLEACGPYIKEGLVHGLRLSTRPDALPPDEIEFLKTRGVTTIEIGAQSMDDRVLQAAGRGHSAAQTRAAAKRVKAAGLGLGLQLMPGLPQENGQSRDLTLSRVLALKPDEARLYPLLVLEGAPLAGLYQKGGYQPLDLERAVSVCADMFRRLTLAGTTVIRIGLHPEPGLARSLLAGPFHPAFGHLVKSEVFLETAARVLAERPPRGKPGPTILVAPQDLSQALGPGRTNLTRLADRYGLPGLCIRPDLGLARGHFQWQGETYPTLKQQRGPGHRGRIGP